MNNECPAPQLGLRARKRLSTMRRIREAALERFEARGFDAVTIEEIADAVEVSQSSVYRAFGTKEGIVLRDEVDDEWITAVADALAVAQPDRPGAALSRLIASADLAASMPDAARRIRIAIDVPSVRAAAGLEADEMAGRIVTELERRGAADPFGARIAVRALIAASFVGFEAAIRAPVPRGPARGATSHADAGERLADALAHVLAVAAPLIDANSDRFRPPASAS